MLAAAAGRRGRLGQEADCPPGANQRSVAFVWVGLDPFSVRSAFRGTWRGLQGIGRVIQQTSSRRRPDTSPM